MRDWRELAREELRSRGLACGGDVAEELGSFLEDAQRELLDGGTPPDVAETAVLERAGDWARLARGLRGLGEDPMERARRLWIPGLLNVVAAFGLLRVATASGVEPFVLVRDHAAFLVYWQWLPVLALTGAAAAWWSGRRQAPSRERAIAGLSPALAMLSFLAVAFVVGAAVDAAVPLAVRLEALAGMLVTWVIVPGAASLLGTAAALATTRLPERRPA
jgi:hypothetical protein